jgi:hypothetical protein
MALRMRSVSVCAVAEAVAGTAALIDGVEADSSSAVLLLFFFLLWFGIFVDDESIDVVVSSKDALAFDFIYSASKALISALRSIDFVLA